MHIFLQCSVCANLLYSLIPCPAPLPVFLYQQVEQIPVGSPYVAAEVSPAQITLPYTFSIGDQEATNSINDFPSLYSNPSLEEGTSYTAFIRVFPLPADPVSSLPPLNMDASYV